MSKVINWTQYFMGVAKLSAYRSKDPNTQVGACIVNSDNKIVGVGIMVYLGVVKIMSFLGKLEKGSYMRLNIPMWFMQN